jgi:hypothetical protein
VDDSQNTGMLSEGIPPEKIKKIFKKAILDVNYLKRLLPAITPPCDYTTCNVTSVTSKLPATDCIVFKSNTTYL